MRSIKPGRGPSGISFLGSVFAIIFGIFWTIMVISMTASTGGMGPMGVFFPLFGIFIIGIGIVQAIYHLRNATGKDRFSTYDITEPHEENDPSDAWVKNYNKVTSPISKMTNEKPERYCPYCGEALKADFEFCPSCGKKIA